MSAVDRESSVYNAKMSEQAERYDEMIEYMSEVARNNASELSIEERNLLSVAYKNIIGSRRTSWRVLSSIEQREEQKSPDSPRLPLVKKFRLQVEEEMKKICREVAAVLDDHLIPKASTPEALVFFQKMKGDYFRYLAEFLVADEKNTSAENSLFAYKAASEEAEKNLPCTHPIRLGLALNFSVFYYEIMNQPDVACNLAKEAFDEAIAKLDGLPEENYKDSTLIMQLLRDNLTLWTSDLLKDGGGGDNEKEQQPGAHDVEDA